ncbi:hypothetical protein [Geodermatophilus sp. DSM 44513]|uniref:hypothetical protein n=1 Tax=Geodermatophilus sp. DSM 44513 TaxID=1528104 RepID=UPI00126B6426|nr:hypothetical protein [Geodermatophilus sp. DSM 44513]WNV74448.1 hypothetical protein RTG05_15835 [Geodermatophilus sp. DSM 44513]
MGSRRDPRFAAVLLVAQEVFPLDRRVWKHLDESQQRANFAGLLADKTFSAKEHLLLEITASLWSSHEHPTLLGVVAERLGNEWLATVLRALTVARGAALPPGTGPDPLGW